MDIYELKIDFVKDSGRPSRVFRSMAGLIESFERFDVELVASLGSSLVTDLVLQDVNSGSIRSVLKRILELPDKEAMRDGDWKKVVGRMLDDAREFFIRKLDENPRIETVDQLYEIQNGILQIAEIKLPQQLLPTPNLIPLSRILGTIKMIEASTRVLVDGDTVAYIHDERQTEITTEVRVGSDVENQILLPLPINLAPRMVLPVKKPDLIGDSQWELYIGSKVVRAKIKDAKWLQFFHDRTVELKPGDALDADVSIMVLYDEEGAHVSSRYEIEEVHGVIPATKWQQMDFSDDLGI